jgi:hypothetical protein
MNLFTGMIDIASMIGWNFSKDNQRGDKYEKIENKSNFDPDISSAFFYDSSGSIYLHG